MLALRRRAYAARTESARRALAVRPSRCLLELAGGPYPTSPGIPIPEPGTPNPDAAGPGRGTPPHPARRVGPSLATSQTGHATSPPTGNPFRGPTARNVNTGPQGLWPCITPRPALAARVIQGRDSLACIHGLDKARIREYVGAGQQFRVTFLALDFFASGGVDSRAR